MADKVDVLAVMDRADAHYAGWNISAADKAVLDDLNDARAAVAELIAAGDAATEVTLHDGMIAQSACDRLVAALARCKGEGA